MRMQLAAAGLVLAVLGAGFSVPRTLFAQEASAEEGQRKVRTKVVPDIPDLAKRLHVAGKVKIEATIAADGHVLDMRVIGGSPLLVNAALQALKQWRFEPAPATTTAVIEFSFNEQGSS
jgi:TonB family protein